MAKKLNVDEDIISHARPVGVDNRQRRVTLVGGVKKGAKKDVPWSRTNNQPIGVDISVEQMALIKSATRSFHIKKPHWPHENPGQIWGG